MASLNIEESDIPSLADKVALITGGSAGIGLATTKLLLEKGATVHVLDVNPPPEEDLAHKALHYRRCNVAIWEDLRKAFDEVGHVDYVFANAGIYEESDYFADETDAEGALVEPGYRVLDVNLRAACNTVKLAWSKMRKQPAGRPYSVVLTASIAAYAPEQVCPVYSSAKLALVGLIRSLRPMMIRDGITINGVAPGATITNILPAHLAEAFITQAPAAVGLPRFVGLALVYSAVATQDRQAEAFGKDKDADLWTPGRWNGRVILALGTTYTELEEPAADLRPFWFGRENTALWRRAQAAIDTRDI
ncbi:short chain dehydrogenase reductase [Xylaria longipes]|nr:short chain dehydrogenase reductase [Xylaria longipes]